MQLKVVFYLKNNIKTRDRRYFWTDLYKIVSDRAILLIDAKSDIPQSRIPVHILVPPNVPNPCGLNLHASGAGDIHVLQTASVFVFG